MNQTEILLESIESFLEANNKDSAIKLIDKYVSSQTQKSLGGLDELTNIIQNNIQAINSDKQMQKLSHSCPAARDKLQYVIDESEKRVEDTINRLSKIRSILYSNTANNAQTILEINNHLTKILENQEIQDIGAQIIQKAIILVGGLEEQLIKASGSDAPIKETTASNHQDSSQIDIDDLFQSHGSTT